PATGVELRIVGDDGADCPSDAVGEVALRGRHMLAGWIDQGGYHALASDDWHLTGDLGRRDRHGRLHLVGRTADMLKTGGYKVAPEEVERALAGSAGASEIVVLGLPSDYWGEVVVAVAEAPPAGWAAQAAAAAETLARYKRPRAYLVLPELP